MEQLQQTVEHDIIGHGQGRGVQPGLCRKPNQPVVSIWLQG